MRLLPKSYYTNSDVVSIARNLLGKVLVTEVDGIICKGIIVETEAYRSPDDRACHAFNEKITPRTKTMFESGGIAYVYVCYGMHRMINVVTATKGHAHAVLIRAIDPIKGHETLAARRGHKKLKKETTNGPGKLCQAMAISTIMDAQPLYKKQGGLWIEDHNLTIAESEIIAGPRVGLSKLTGPDAHRPWRFTIDKNKYISYPKVVKYPEEWKAL